MRSPFNLLAGCLSFGLDGLAALSCVFLNASLSVFLTASLLAFDAMGKSSSELYFILKSWRGSSWFQLGNGLSFFVPEILSAWLLGILSAVYRSRKSHAYIIGKSGAGKTSTIQWFLHRDVRCGHGIALIEPHGELTEDFLRFDLFRIGHRSQAYKRLVVLDFESSNPTPFNIFKVPLPEDKDERQIRIDELAASYMPAFELTIRPEMTDKMYLMLKNIITAVFHLDDPSFLDLVRILDPENRLDPRYGELFRSLENQVLRGYFETDFFGKTINCTKEGLKDRLQGLLVQRQLQKSLLAKENAVDFQGIMREGKILVVKARKERVGEFTSRMIGNLVHQFLYAEAFRRINEPGRRIPFFIYMDECQNYINKSVIDGLSETRKFGFFYMLANQRLNQNMTLEQQKALLDCKTKLCGLVNARDVQEVAASMSLNQRQRKRLMSMMMKPGEFFFHTDGRLPKRVKFSSAFTGRGSVYMGKGSCRQLAEYLSGREANVGGRTKPSLQEKQSELWETKRRKIRTLDTSKFTVGLAA